MLEDTRKDGISSAVFTTMKPNAICPIFAYCFQKAHKEGFAIIINLPSKKVKLNSK